MNQENPPKAVKGGPKTIHIANRRSALNDLHRFWSKKPYAAIEEYIQHFTRVGDLVLDPFCGRGTTGFASRLLGLPSFNVDSSPIAIAVTESKLAVTNPVEIVSTAKQLLETVEKPREIPEGEFRGHPGADRGAC